jgi:hypothetical protein
VVQLRDGSAEERATVLRRVAERALREARHSGLEPDELVEAIRVLSGART